MSNAWIEVDLNAIRSNVVALRSVLSPGVAVIAMVKGNAYGHGAPAVARAVLSGGASKLGVARLSEAMELREHGVTSPILLVGGFCSPEIKDLVAFGITPSVFDLDLAGALAAEAVRHSHRVSVHVDVDTGMGRLGVPYEQAPLFVEELKGMKGLHVEGIFTHLSSADEPDQSYSHLQIERFRTVLEQLEDRNVFVPCAHVQNSAGVLNLPDVTFPAVRPGLLLYGLYPSTTSSRRVSLSPALSFYSRVVQVKRVPSGSTVSYNRTYKTPTARNLATISAGFADGVLRQLSSKGRVLVNGRSYPIAGRVTMDQIVIDLDRDESVRPGDRATLIGRDGDEEITAEELAQLAGTINYDVTTSISRRVRRVYHDAI